jgi:hypothetical protein
MPAGLLRNMIYCMHTYLLVSGLAHDHNIVRCMEHSLHLAAKHFVEAVAPASASSIRKKVKAALRSALDGGDLNAHEFDEVLFSMKAKGRGRVAVGPSDDYDDGGDGDDEDDNDGEDDDEMDDTDFTPGDSLGKALALVKQACSVSILHADIC